MRQTELEGKVAAAKQTIDAVFSESSVGPEENRDALEELREYIGECLSALEEDAKRHQVDDDFE